MKITSTIVIEMIWSASRRRVCPGHRAASFFPLSRGVLVIAAVIVVIMPAWVITQKASSSKSILRMRFGWSLPVDRTSPWTSSTTTCRGVISCVKNIYNNMCIADFHDKYYPNTADGTVSIVVCGVHAVSCSRRIISSGRRGDNYKDKRREQLIA